MNYSELIGSNIIYNWYLEFENIITIYSDYVNILIEYTNKLEDQPESIYPYARRIRSLIVSNCLRSESIIKAINSNNEKEIKKLKDVYMSIVNDSSENLLIKKNDIEKYINIIQGILVQDGIQEILANAESTINNVFGSKSESNTGN